MELYAFVSSPVGGAGTYVRIDMEKGKRLNPALQPANVDSAGTAISATITQVGGIGGILGGDPMLMLQDVQNMAGSGQIGVPVNTGMRDFMTKFGWVSP